MFFVRRTFDVEVARDLTAETFAQAFEHLAQTLLTASLRTTGSDRPLSAERQIPIVIDRKYQIPLLPAARADGALLGWPDHWLPMPGKPLAPTGRATGVEGQPGVILSSP